MKISLFFSKKGFTYLLVTSLAVIVILGIFFASSAYKYQDQEQLYQVRINVMNDFVKNLNYDIHRASYIAAYRTMLALEEYVTSNGVYLNDINASFKETFFYGTINGTDAALMENSSFSDYLSKVEQLSSQTGIVVNATVTQITLSQPDPWSINVNISMMIYINDSKKVATWVINNSYETNIPIYNLRDPLYSMNTFNRLPNTIRVSNTTILVNGSNTSALQYLINNSYYLASTYAPSFLDRFEGKTSPDQYGIESMVDIRALSDQDIAVNPNAVKIDYIYFNNISTDKICNVQNIPSDNYFVIPSNRISVYQISGLNYSSSCP